jgi:hypothetical protein
LAGVTLSLIDFDDTNGQCDQGTYPLLNAAADAFNWNVDTSKPEKNVDSSSNGEQRQHVLCSISSKVQTYRNPIRFTLDKIDARLCTHLLIDYQNSLLTTSISRQLKMSNKNLKILLSISSNDLFDIEQLKDIMKKKNADGFNIDVVNDRSTKNITELIQVSKNKGRHDIDTFLRHRLC